MDKKIYLLILFILGLTLRSYSQIPTNQDCLDAIPVCQKVFIQPNAYSGTGNYPNEINPALSCLNQGEKNDVWYVFTVQTTGQLNFTIIPNNPANDYDWALFNLTNAICSDIFNNPGLQVSCNFSGLPGNTGANGLPGLQNNPTVPVLVGQTYVLNISNFSTSQSGYTLDFTPSTATIYDTIPPTMDSVSTLNCGVDSLVVKFSENVACSSVQLTDFTFTNPAGNPVPLTNVTSSVCVSGGDYSKYYIIHFAPAINASGNYTLSLVDTVLDVCGNAGIFPASLVITVPGVNLVMDSTNVVCPGGNTGTAIVQNIIGGTGPFTYLWSNGQTTATATGLVSGNYTVTVSPSVGCSAISSVSVTAPTAFVVNSTITDAVCGQSNGSCVLNVTGGTGAYTYAWSSGNSNSATASGLASGAYTATITDANNCSVVYNFNIANLNGATVSISAFTNVSCFGGNNGTATAAAANGSGNYSWLWSNGSTTNPVNNFSAGIFTVTVTDITAGCTATVTVTIQQPATAVTVSLVSTATSCGTPNGTATATGNNGTGPYTYLWTTGSTNANITGLAQGTFTVTVSDANNCTVTGTIAVNASNAPTLNVSSTTDVKCNGGNDGAANLSCPTCAGVSTYLWSNGSTGNSLNNLSAGTYTITVTDANNCTATSTLVINQPAALTISAIPNDTICSSQASTISTVVNGGTGVVTYLWSNSQTSASINVSPLANTVYTVTVTDANNCTSSQTANVIVNPPLSVTVSNDTTICSGSNVTITAYPSGGDQNYSYSWNGGAAVGSSVTLSPTNDTTLTVVLTDGCGSPSTNAVVNIYVTKITLSISGINDTKCYNGADGTATVNIVSGGTAPFSFLWSNGATTSVVSNFSAGVFTATVTDINGCSATNSVTINEPSQLIATGGSNPKICIGQNVNLIFTGSGGTPPYSYLWSNGSTSTTINVSPVINTSYTITITDANNCSVMAGYIVSVYPPLSITSISNDTSICKGQSLTIKVIPAGGNGNYIYAWGSGITTSSFIITPIQDTAVFVTISDNCGTPIISDSVHILVIDAPIVDFTYTPDHGCQPLTVTFTDTSIAAPGSTYDWDFGDGGNSLLQNPVWTYIKDGLFDVTLTVTTPQGCQTKLTKPAIIDVYPQPVAAFNYTPDFPTLFNPGILFSDLSSGGVNSWLWNFGDTSASVSIQNPFHTYTDTGSFPVTLIVSNQYLCIDTTVVVIIIRDEFSFFIPNAFTPNNDGMNDSFNVFGVNYSSFRAKIFNRWGQLIKEAASNPLGVITGKAGEVVWDGKDFNGELVQSGTYSYFITAYETYTNKKHEFRGLVRLVR